MEEAGRIRRGYFVDGLGPPSSRWPGRVDRLRALREPDRGTGTRSTCWPRPTRPSRTVPPCRGRAAATTDRRPFQRAAGAYVVLVDGVAVLYLERGGPRACRRFPAADDRRAAGIALRALRRPPVRRAAPGLVLRTVDGEPVGQAAPGRSSPGGGRLRPGLPRAVPARPARRAGAHARRRHALPDSRRAAAAPGRPAVMTAARARVPGPPRGAGRRARRSWPSSRWARTC